MALLGGRGGGTQLTSFGQASGLAGQGRPGLLTTITASSAFLEARLSLPGLGLLFPLVGAGVGRSPGGTVPETGFLWELFQPDPALQVRL